MGQALMKDPFGCLNEMCFDKIKEWDGHEAFSALFILTHAQTLFIYV